MTYPEAGLYIDSEWTDGTYGRGDDIVNPATGQVLGRVPFAGPSTCPVAGFAMSSPPPPVPSVHSPSMYSPTAGYVMESPGSS